MESQKIENLQVSTLQMKLALLDSLNKGEIERAHRLLQRVCFQTNESSQLYRSFKQFVSENKVGYIVIEMEQEEKQENQARSGKVEFLDDDQDNSFDQNQSWSLSSESEEEREKKSDSPSKNSQANQAKQNPPDMKSSVKKKTSRQGISAYIGPDKNKKVLQKNIKIRH